MLESPHIVGIAGPTCSGKTSIAQLLSEKLPGSVPVLSLDSYYRDLPDLPSLQRKEHNFDVPEALDYGLLSEQIRRLAGKETIEKPIYDFSNHSRMSKTERIIPEEFIVVEGLFALYWEDIRNRLTLKIFIDLNDETSLNRRIERDVRERGRTRASVVSQYQLTVKPMYEKYVLPTRKHADIILNGREPAKISVSVILKRVKKTPSTEDRK